MNKNSKEKMNKVKLFSYVSLSFGLFAGYSYYVMRKKPKKEIKEKTSLLSLKDKLDNLNKNLGVYHKNMKDINGKLSVITKSIEETNERIKELENNSSGNNQVSYFENLNNTSSLLESTEKKSNLVTEF
jgi:predicted  nucleic acid-binding Zn-ribbon protein